MDPFVDMTNAVYDTLAVDGTYTPVGGGASLVRVVVTRRDPHIDLGVGAGQAAGYLASVRTADVAVPKKNDRLTAAGASYVVRGVTLDSLGLTNQLDVDRLP